MLAASLGHVSIVRTLIRYHASPSYHAFDKKTAFDFIGPGNKEKILKNIFYNSFPDIFGRRDDDPISDNFILRRSVNDFKQIFKPPIVVSKDTLDYIRLRNATTSREMPEADALEFGQFIEVEHLKRSKPRDEELEARGAEAAGDVLPDTLPHEISTEEKYDAWRKKHGSHLLTFLETGWPARYIRAHLLTRSTFRDLDKSGEQALQNWLRHHELPSNLLIPRKKDLTDEALKHVDREQLRKGAQLAAADRRRQK
jgi:hypothetical protein